VNEVIYFLVEELLHGFHWILTR